MNLASVIVLAIMGLLFFLAVRSIFRRGPGCGCGGCSGDCSHCGSSCSCRKDPPSQTGT